MAATPLLALAYILSALLTAVGALILTARAASGEPNLGGGLSLQTIAAAVIGGVSLSGGRGGLDSAVIGTFFITILVQWYESGEHRRLYADAGHGSDHHLGGCA